jgi:hypothetical protein
VGGGEAKSGIAVTRNGGGRGIFSGIGDGVLPGEAVPDSGYGDSGTYSRFFIIPKADRSDREPVVGIGGEAKSGQRVNAHPTPP